MTLVTVVMRRKYFRKSWTLLFLLSLSLSGFFISCQKSVSVNSDHLTLIDTTGTLKLAAIAFPVGVAINYNLMTTNSSYASLVKKEFDVVTFEYQMKQGAIVNNDGSFNYSNANHLVQVCTQDGLKIHGHTLIWYQNNNGDYLRSLVSGGGVGGNTGPNLVTNGGFENWTGSAPTGWSIYNHANGTFTQGTGANVYSGKYSLKVTTTLATSSWKLQIASPTFSTIKGESYKVSFWIKTSTSGCHYQVEWRSPTANYTGDQSTPTRWTLETFTFKAGGVNTLITLDMGNSPDSITYIDDLQCSHVISSAAGPSAQDTANVGSFMEKYIVTTVKHFKGEVTGWDVINEPLNSKGKIRTNPNPSQPTTGGIFYWDEYLGRSYIATAFKEAHAADPDAQLFINEYNLESNTVKLDSLISLADQLKAENVPIDGIGTQMHISINTSHNGIDETFKALASTGLKIRVSELDVRINPNDEPNFQLTSQLLSLQQEMYHYVVWSYMKYIPKAQQAGITVWDLTDKDSWIVVDQKKNDYPTLFNANYQKKPAFYGFLSGLKGNPITN